MKNKKQIKSEGFSLVEVLIGAVIVISATVVVLSIIISSFRISSKTTASTVIRQNGNYALSQTSRMVQFAESFDGIICSGNTYTSCITARNSCSEVLITYNRASRRITCSGGLGIDGQSSVDTSKVTVTRCNFTCTQNIDESPIIGIDFDLSIGNPGEVVENRSSINFSTSVKMRNL